MARMVEFCRYCGTLLFPGADRCTQCYRPNEGLKSNQMGLFEISAKGSEPKLVSDKDHMAAPYLPYEPREGQLEIISDIRDALDQGRHAVIESGTGTGKTIVSLASALEHSIPRGKRIIYMSRTITQSDQVMKELRAISKLRPVFGVTILGRNKSCPQFRGAPGMEGDGSGLLARMCEDSKAKNRCPYFRGVKDRLSEVESYCRKNFPQSNDLDDYCIKLGVCPYEMRKLLMKGADVIAVPYVHILSEDIRTNFIKNMDVDEDHILLIIDEAHNLIDSARSQGSFRITISDVSNAIDEASTMKSDVHLYEDVRLSKLLEFLKGIIRAMANEKLGLKNKEALLKPGEVEDRIFSKFNITRANLSIALDEMTTLGEDRVKKLVDNEEVGESHILNLAISLKKWMMTPDDSYIRSIKVDEDGEFLSASCIDPRDVTYFIRRQKGVIHMSGTLRPLDQYIRTLGLPKDTFSNTYPSPFPKENRRTIYLTDVTMRQEDLKKYPYMKNNIERRIVKAVNSASVNSMVMFTSYDKMKDMRPILDRDIRKPKYWETYDKFKTKQALERFRSGRDGVFFCVMGGSIAEGMDFPGDQLNLVIIVGVPYAPPNLENNAMMTMFNSKYGDGVGFRFVSEVPAIRKMKQAIGRLIRTESDYGMAIIMDQRAGRFAKDLDAVPATDVVKEVKEFFLGRGSLRYD